MDAGPQGPPGDDVRCATSGERVGVTGGEAGWRQLVAVFCICYLPFACMGLAAWLAAGGAGAAGRAVFVALLGWRAVDAAAWGEGRPSAWVRDWWIFQRSREYFPAHLVQEEPRLGPGPRLILFHPHGIVCSPVWLHMGRTAFERRNGVRFRMCTINMNFWIPVWTDFLLAFGLISCSRRVILRNLRAGNTVGLVVGGAEEAGYGSTGGMDLVLNKRRGFVKCALQTGAALVPCVTIGENDIIRQVQAPPASRLWRFHRWFAKRFGFTPVLPYGRGFLGFPFGAFPFQSPLLTVLGKPLAVPRIESPSPAEVEEWHGRYVEHLRDVYNRNRDKFAPGADDLRIIA